MPLADDRFFEQPRRQFRQLHVAVFGNDRQSFMQRLIDERSHFLAAGAHRYRMKTLDGRPCREAAAEVKEMTDLRMQTIRALLCPGFIAGSVASGDLW